MRKADVTTTQCALLAAGAALVGVLSLIVCGLTGAQPWLGLAVVAQLVTAAAAVSCHRLHRLQHRELLETSREHHRVMLSNMSHEVLTPMNAVMGLSEQLLLGELAPPLHRDIAQIHSSGSEMVRRLETILDYCALESDLLELERESFYLDALLAELAHQMRPDAEAKGLSLHLDNVSAPLCMVGDRQRLHRLVEELLRNAIEFSHQGQVRLEAQVRDDRLHLVVCDEGPGLTPEDLEAIWAPFCQLDTRSIREHRGLGLGLSVARQVADLMDAQLVARSQPGQGSSFALQLALTRGDMPKRHHEGAPSAEPSGGVLRALVVEDNAVNQHVASRLLRQLGLTVTVVDNGQLAVDHLTTSEVDLVLMDLHMPIMDGAEATAAIRRDLTRPQPRIVAMTASALSHDRRRCFDVGMDDVLHKPLSRQKLAAVLGHFFPMVELDRERIRELK